MALTRVVRCIALPCSSILSGRDSPHAHVYHRRRQPFHQRWSQHQMGSAHAPPHCTVHCANQPTLPRQGDQGLTGSAQAEVRRHTPKVQTTVCMCDKCIAARVRPHASACRTSPSRRGSTCISLGTSSKSRCAPRGHGWSRGPEERARARRAGQPAPDPSPSPNPHPNPTQDLTTDFGDGIKLIKLVENISEES